MPDYLGIGTHEDSLTSCYSLIPRAPKKDNVTYLMNANKKLRYGCILDSMHPEEQDRKFIMTYNLADGNLSIVELSSINSGIMGGKFLSSRRIVKPNSNPNKPEYYAPKDFAIGSRIFIFAHRFVITSADLYVYRYMQAYPEHFTPSVIESVRMYNLREGNLTEDLRRAVEQDQERYLNELKRENQVLKEGNEEEEELFAPTRIPNPQIHEDEVKKYYHDQEDIQPSYMENKKCALPCNINTKEDGNIPSDFKVVRFLEPHEQP